jgi:hypothetical protein
VRRDCRFASLLLMVASACGLLGETPSEAELSQRFNGTSGAESSGVSASEPVAQEQGRYILITRESLAGEFQRLVDRRASQGFDAVLLTVEDIDSIYSGFDIQAKIRNCVKSLYDPCTPLFVSLGGDALLGQPEQSIVPVRVCNPNGDEEMPADIYYADVDGGSWDTNQNGVFGEVGDVGVDELTPEAHLGRIAVRSIDEVRAYIQKVITYEEADLAGYSDSMIVVSGTKAGVAYETGYARPPGFSDHDPVSPVEIRYTEEYLEIQSRWQAVPLHLLFDTKTSWDEQTCGDYALHKEHLMEQLSGANQGRGYHIMRHIGHSNCGKMGLGREKSTAFKAADISTLTNSVPGIMISSSCGTAHFDGKCEPCIGEAFIRNPYGGAVAYFGPSRSSSLNYTKEYLLDELLQAESISLGEALSNARRKVASRYVSNPRMPYIYTLLGDPAIKRLPVEDGRHVQVFQPLGCEVVDSGGDLYIRWNATGTAFQPEERVKLDYSGDGGETWSSIPGAEALSYNGRCFVWQNCPLPPGNRYRIRVTCLSDPTSFHCSPKDFTIAVTGMVTVRCFPEKGLFMEGSHGNQTPYTWSAGFGDAIHIIAPEKAGDLTFLGWTNAHGDTISSSRDLSFVYDSETAVVAQYGYPQAEQDYYVNDAVAEDDVATGSDQNDGLSRTSPKRTLAGLFSAYPDLNVGDRIYISAGIYAGNLHLGSNNSGIIIQGAGPERTFIRGNDKRCITLDQCSGFILDGITFCQGSADSGAGLLSDHSSGKICDCIFSQNGATERGGGLWCDYSHLWLVDCRFLSNTAEFGGAVSIQEGSSIDLERCEVMGNHAERWGGGISLKTGDNHLVLRNSLICENTCAVGGAIHLAYFVTYSGHYTTLDLSNCTLAHNTAANGPALYADMIPESAVIDIQNSIVWNGKAQIVPPTHGLTIEYSDVEGGWPGSGNIDVNPRFVQSGDYHLMSFEGRWDEETGSWVNDDELSPCIDAGDPSSDWSQEPWPNGSRINMGAYGGTAEASMSETE